MSLAFLWAWSSREGWTRQRDSGSYARFKNVSYASTCTGPGAAVPLRRLLANGNTQIVCRRSEHRRTGDYHWLFRSNDVVRSTASSPPIKNTLGYAKGGCQPLSFF